MRGSETWGGVVHDLACNVHARGDELSILLPRLCAGDADMENAVRSLLVGTLDAWRTRGSTLTHFEQAGRRCDGSIELLPGSAFVEDVRHDCAAGDDHSSGPTVISLSISCPAEMEPIPTREEPITSIPPARTYYEFLANGTGGLVCQHDDTTIQDAKRLRTVAGCTIHGQDSTPHIRGLDHDQIAARGDRA